MFPTSDDVVRFLLATFRLEGMKCRLMICAAFTSGACRVLLVFFEQIHMWLQFGNHCVLFKPQRLTRFSVSKMTFQELWAFELEAIAP